MKYLICMSCVLIESYILSKPGKKHARMIVRMDTVDLIYVKLWFYTIMWCRIHLKFSEVARHSLLYSEKKKKEMILAWNKCFSPW